MAGKNIYIVIKDDSVSLDPIGVFNREGLLKFLREQKKRARWDYHYEVNESGHKKLIKRIKIYPRLKVVAHKLNKCGPGTIYYEWYLIK